MPVGYFRSNPAPCAVVWPGEYIHTHTITSVVTPPMHKQHQEEHDLSVRAAYAKIKWNMLALHLHLLDVWYRVWHMFVGLITHGCLCHAES